MYEILRRQTAFSQLHGETVTCVRPSARYSLGSSEREEKSSKMARQRLRPRYEEKSPSTATPPARSDARPPPFGLRGLSALLCDDPGVDFD